MMSSLFYSFIASCLSIGTLIPCSLVIAVLGKKRQESGKPYRKKWKCVLITASLWIASTIVTTLIMTVLMDKASDGAYYSTAFLPSLLLVIWAYHIICDGQCELRYYKNELISYRQFAKALRDDIVFTRIQFSSLEDREAEILRRWNQLNKPATINEHPLDIDHDEESAELSIDHSVTIQSDPASDMQSKSDSVIQTVALKSSENKPKTTKSFCRKCGSELPQDSKFCNKCGTKVKVIR